MLLLTFTSIIKTQFNIETTVFNAMVFVQINTVK